MRTNTRAKQSISYQSLEDEARSLNIKFSIDSKRAGIVIDITSAVKENIIVSTKDANDKIVNVFSWYVLHGRNVSSIKNLIPGVYIIQILSIEGELIAAYSISFPKRIK
jgi:hypothetical protein